MDEVFAELWRRGHHRLVLIGSDLPVLRLEILREAFKYLDAPDRRAVLGPSQDGGYYLVGMNQAIPEIFSGMTWSHDRVLADSLVKLRELCINFAFATRLVRRRHHGGYPTIARSGWFHRQRDHEKNLRVRATAESGAGFVSFPLSQRFIAECRYIDTSRHDIHLFLTLHAINAKLRC